MKLLYLCERKDKTVSFHTITSFAIGANCYDFGKLMEFAGGSGGGSGSGSAGGGGSSGGDGGCGGVIPLYHINPGVRTTHSK